MMARWTRRRMLGGLGGLGGAALALRAGPVRAAVPGQPGGGVVLTVAGDTARANRGPLDPRIDAIFSFHGIGFERAFSFDRAMLDALPRETFEARLPEGHDKAAFTGPRLAAVLEMAGAARGASLRTVALDGYVTELSAAAIAGGEWFVVLARNAAPLGIGGFGPAMLLAKPPVLDVAEDAAWPWAVFYIEVSG